MTDTLLLSSQFRVQYCYKQDCRLAFALPRDFDDELRKNHQPFYCPRGHCQSYQGKTEEEKLRDQLAAKARAIEYLEADRATARAQRDHFKRSAAIVKGKHQAMKTRIAAGICPCCRRPFANLMRHMQNQHPAFNATKDE